MQAHELPTLQFYTFGSAELGSQVYTLATGSNARCPNEEDSQEKKGRSQAGLLTWVHRVSKSARLWIMKQWYGNEPEAVKKLRQEGVEGAKFVDQHFKNDTSQFNEDNFTAEAFLVCSGRESHNYMYCSTNTRTLSYSSAKLLQDTLPASNLNL